MGEEELEEIVNAWIAAQEAHEAEKDGPEYEKNEWAVHEVIDWSLAECGNPELLWRFILKTYKHDFSEYIAGMLAAGPVEDLLSNYGPDYIARVEELAQKDGRFKWLLGGVWRLGMTDEVWQRLRSARGEVW